MSHPSEQPATVPAELARAVEARVACPSCYASVTVREQEIRCVRSGCGFTGATTGGIPIMRGQRDRSFFDDKHAVMEHGSAEPGVRRCCYAEQATAIESVIPGGVVVDVGCGPALPYRRSEALVPDRLRHVVRIAARPSLKIPRLLFDVHLYHWTV